MFIHRIPACSFYALSHRPWHRSCSLLHYLDSKVSLFKRPSAWFLFPGDYSCSLAIRWMLNPDVQQSCKFIGPLTVINSDQVISSTPIFLCPQIRKKHLKAPVVLIAVLEGEYLQIMEHPCTGTQMRGAKSKLFQDECGAVCCAAR